MQRAFIFILSFLQFQRKEKRRVLTRLTIFAGIKIIWALYIIWETRNDLIIVTDIAWYAAKNMSYGVVEANEFIYDIILMTWPTSNRVFIFKMAAAAILYWVFGVLARSAVSIWCLELLC